MLILVLQRLLVEMALDFLYFPIWWYTNGLKRAAVACARLFQSGNSALLPLLWLKNIFVPMYGQNDWQGRMMSFFIRVVNVIIRGALTLVWLLVSMTLLFLWVVFPIIVCYMLIFSLSKVRVLSPGSI